MKKRLVKVTVIGMVFLLAGIFYAFFVEATGIGVPCPFYVVTGYYCPGCGVTHMCIALLRLDFAAAAQCNLVVFLLLPVFLVIFVKNVLQYIRCGRYRLGKAENIILGAAIALLVGFGVWRNLF